MQLALLRLAASLFLFALVARTDATPLPKGTGELNELNHEQLTGVATTNKQTKTDHLPFSGLDQLHKLWKARREGSGSGSGAVTSAPSDSPSTAPTVVGSGSGSGSVTSAPSAAPSTAPTATGSGSGSVTNAPSAAPSTAPTATGSGSGSVTSAPSAGPSTAPTATGSGSGSVTSAPSAAPSTAPSAAPSTAPSAAPSTAPTAAPSTAPTAAPSVSPTNLPTRAPTFTSPPTTLAPTFDDGFTVTYDMSFPDLTASDVLDPDFQDSIIDIIAELTGIDASFISLLFGRRTASVTAQVQAASTSEAASASSAVTASVASGGFTTSLNSALATTSYSGATVTTPTVTVSTQSTSTSSSSSSEFYEEAWFLGVCAGIGFLLLGAIVAAIVFTNYKRRNRSLKEFDNVGVTGDTAPLYEASGIMINASGSSPKHSSSLSMKPDSFIGKQNEIGLEIEMSGLAPNSDDHMMRESHDEPVDFLQMQSEDVDCDLQMQSEDVDLNTTQGEDAFAVDLSPKHNSVRN